MFLCGLLKATALLLILWATVPRNLKDSCFNTAGPGLATFYKHKTHNSGVYFLFFPFFFFAGKHIDKIDALIIPLSAQTHKTTPS